MPTIKDLLNKGGKDDAKPVADPFAALRTSLDVANRPPDTASNEQAGEVNSGTPSKDNATASPAAISADEFNAEEQPEQFSEKEIEDFKNALEVLSNNIDNKEVVGQATASLLQLIQNNENVRQMLQPEDIRLMVRGLRESYGTAIVKKETKQTKKVVSEKNVDGLMKDMSDLDFSI